MSAFGSFTPKVVFRQGEKEYLAKAFGPDQVPGKTAWGYGFVISSEGGGKTRHTRGVSSYLWEDSAEIAALGESDESRKPFLCRAIIRTGFRYLQERLAQGAEIEPEFLHSGRDTVGTRKLAEAAQRKECEHRTAARRGHVCELAMESGVAAPLTTTARCNECGFPEVFYRCRHLRGGMVDVRDLRTPQLRFEPVCDRGKGLRDPEECLSRDCFEPWVVNLTEAEDSAVAPRADCCPFGERHRSCRQAVTPDPALVFIAGSASDEIAPVVRAVERGVQAAGMTPYFATSETVKALGDDAFCTKVCGQIRSAAFCIVIMDAPTHREHKGVSLHSPNVYFEYGLMKGFNRKVFPLRNKAHSAPFDLAHIETCEYDTLEEVPVLVKEGCEDLSQQPRP